MVASSHATSSPSRQILAVLPAERSVIAVSPLDVQSDDNWPHWRTLAQRRSFADHSASACAAESSDGTVAAEPTRRASRTSGRPATATNVAMMPDLSLIHISEPTRLLSNSYAVICLKK